MEFTSEIKRTLADLSDALQLDALRTSAIAVYMPGLHGNMFDVRVAQDLALLENNIAISLDRIASKIPEK